MRTFGRAGRGRGVLAGTLALLYLSLSISALTCALHHDITGACPHHAGPAAAGHHAMAHGAGHDHGAMPMGGSGGAHAGLCKCLDKLAAEPPADLVAVAVPSPVAAVEAAPAAVPALRPAGPARPRAPPYLV